MSFMWHKWSLHGHKLDVTDEIPSCGSQNTWEFLEVLFTSMSNEQMLRSWMHRLGIELMH